MIDSGPVHRHRRRERKSSAIGCCAPGASARASACSMPAITNTDRGRAGLRAWLAHVSEVYERHGAVIRTWTEAELAGDSVARQGDHVLTG